MQAVGKVANKCRAQPYAMLHLVYELSSNSIIECLGD